MPKCNCLRNIVTNDEKCNGVIIKCLTDVRGFTETVKDIKGTKSSLWNKELEYYIISDLLYGSELSTISSQIKKDFS